MTVLGNEIEESYNLIKSTIIFFPVLLHDLEKLKRMFTIEINSKRRYSAISSLEDLLVVLEKRCFLDPILFEPFLKIREVLKDDYLYALISKHHKLVMKWNQQNLFRDINLFQDCNYISSISYSPVEIPEEVVSLICTELDAWEDFARRLGLKESEIDEIENSGIPSNQKVAEVLKCLQREGAGQNLRNCLLKALVGARRTDLSRQVETMFPIEPVF